MIKGKARGGATALAAHLQRRDTNERIHLREFEGVTARDVLGALREMDAMGAGAQSRRTLYHAAINTAPGERLTDDQKNQAVDRLAEELGLAGQPRIVVEHFKKNREHMHVVYLRIDLDTMKAIPDSHNFRKHEIAARDLEREFGHEPVKGVHVGRNGDERPARTPSHGEMQQADRTGITPQQAKKDVTRLWQQADSGRAFAASVTAEGWVLAKGDTRDFVLVDRAGEPHSLPRRVDGAKAADIRQRMSDVAPVTLPTVAEAKEIQRCRTDIAHGKEKEKGKTKAPHASELVVLKVEAPAPDRSPARPLVEPIALPTKPVEKPLPAPSEKEETSGSKLATEKPRQAGPLKRLYEKARDAFQKKVRPAKPFVEKAPSTRTKPQPRPAKPLTPEQRNMQQKLATARAADRNAMPEIERTPADDRLRPEPSIYDRTRERRPKLSREEIQTMMERQRRQREISGPSR